VAHPAETPVQHQTLRPTRHSHPRPTEPDEGSVMMPRHRGERICSPWRRPGPTRDRRSAYLSVGVRQQSGSRPDNHLPTAPSRSLVNSTVSRSS
jgi:hypothetical protein